MMIKDHLQGKTAKILYQEADNKINTLSPELPILLKDGLWRYGLGFVGNRKVLWADGIGSL
jgi:hypothetical protein